MTAFPWASRLAKTPGLVLPIRSFIGITERREEIDKSEIRRSLNGSAVVLRPLYGTLYRTTLSASGPALHWTPAFSGLDKRAVYRIASTLHLDFSIPAGGTQAVLTRDPVPGSVFAFLADDFDERRLPLAVDGRTVTLAAPAARPVFGGFLPFLDCVLADRSAGAAEIEGTKEWSMVFEEQHA
ncbi:MULTISPECIES: hypothetical protein [unclassified Methylobacterium]|uniref:hypothetical protein n=1 Tax=unclassified Methylobacterium TaxID=2615210 RepID=UPI000CCA285C|nr:MULTISPECIES: hypothetical protein [unclassified Methylobacterium]PIU05060.1 MAG: hypothetical protein COT56_16430 [Methylobacterium sp. CG09_land_8_20_14_0_10_71_15]PIU11850.1 MAG: hypothetical protein COT28_17785 [Methylobacterium sp. CG08_land_8_20_14_0_20_71_15]GBU19017.1 hypothetical protein AwMethylo_32320 [Methylobacterium sp.]